MKDASRHAGSPIQSAISRDIAMSDAKHRIIRSSSDNIEDIIESQGANRGAAAADAAANLRSGFRARFNSRAQNLLRFRCTLGNRIARLTADNE